MEGKRTKLVVQCDVDGCTEVRLHKHLDQPPKVTDPHKLLPARTRDRLVPRRE